MVAVESSAHSTASPNGTVVKFAAYSQIWCQSPNTKAGAGDIGVSYALDCTKGMCMRKRWS